MDSISFTLMNFRTFVLVIDEGMKDREGVGLNIDENDDFIVFKFVQTDEST